MKISICIPSYNQEKTIGDAMWSCVEQDYHDKEILVIDDCSTDNTLNCAKSFGTFVRVLKNDKNLGIGGNLTRCMQEAKGEYIIYLCGDDYFAHESVAGDMAGIFEMFSHVGVIGRSYYQFMDKYPGAIGAVREKNILISSVNPSGIGFRKSAMSGEFSNGIFIEMPSMVKTVLKNGWQSRQLHYDTIAVRIKPGQNTCTVSSYYKESPTESFAKIVPDYVNYKVLITLKNRAPHLLLREINVISRIEPACVFKPMFWIYAIIAVLTPRCILRRLSNFYKHRIGRRFCAIKHRVR